MVDWSLLAHDCLLPESREQFWTWAPERRVGCPEPIRLPWFPILFVMPFFCSDHFYHFQILVHTFMQIKKNICFILAWQKERYGYLPVLCNWCAYSWQMQWVPELALQCLMSHDALRCACSEIKHSYLISLTTVSFKPKCINFMCASLFVMQTGSRLELSCPHFRLIMRC